MQNKAKHTEASPLQPQTSENSNPELVDKPDVSASVTPRQLVQHKRLKADQVLQLQRTIGNRAVTRLLSQNSPIPALTHLAFSNQLVERMALKKDHTKKGGKIDQALKRLDSLGLEAEDIKACIAWVENDKQLDIFTENEEAWATYEAIKGKMTAEALRKATGDAGNLLEEARGILAAKAGPVESEPAKPAKKSKEEREAERLEAEEREKEEALEKQKQKEKEAAQLKRTVEMAKYAEIETTLSSNDIAIAAWNLAKSRYIAVGTTGGKLQLQLSGAYSKSDLVAALKHWKSVNNAVQQVEDGKLTGISTFKQPQDKAAKGGGQVGDTLATREKQANFMFYFDSAKPSQVYINVHVDQS